jgi:hypothetical protein
MFQVFAEGYHFGKYYITLVVSCTLILGVGTRMMYVYNYIVRGVLSVYDDECDGKISQEDLDRIQKTGQDPGKLKQLGENLQWFVPKGTQGILQIIRFALFTASVVVAEAVFYAWQVQGDACYFDDRALTGSVLPYERRRAPIAYTRTETGPIEAPNGRFEEIHVTETPWVVIIMAIIAVLLILMLGLVTIPAYVVLNTSSHHQQNQALLHARLHGAHKLHAASHTSHDKNKHEVKGSREKKSSPTGVQVDH